MSRFIHCPPINHALILAVCCQAIFFASPAHAASEEIRAVARVCANAEWADQAGYERAAAYREAVDCLGALYIRVATGAKPESNAALAKAIAKHLAELEAAYHASRNVCRLREKLGLAAQGCGTGGPSPHEFVRLLKTMILDADAFPVRRDPALAEALGLD